MMDFTALYDLFIELSEQGIVTVEDEDALIEALDQFVESTSPYNVA